MNLYKLIDSAPYKNSAIEKAYGLLESVQMTDFRNTKICLNSQMS